MGQSALVRNTGDGDAPYVMGAAFPDASSKVVEMLMAMRSDDGQKGDKSLVDYVNTTSWANLAATARGYTVTLENNTTSVNDTGTGGAGNSAQIDGTSANVGAMLRRTRITRTTLLDSLRGREYVLLRLRTSAASKWEVQLRWSQSLAEPATVSNLAVTHEATSAASTFGYVEIPVGFIEIPEDPNATLVGVALEVWARRLTGTGNLLLNLTRHLPATPGKDVLTRVMVPAGGEERWLGNQLVTPTNPGGLTGGSLLGNTQWELNANNEAAGTPPVTGLAWPAGRHQVAFTLLEDSSGLVDYIYRVRNITDSTDAATQTVTNAPGGVVTKTLALDSVAGKSYQPQVVKSSADIGSISINYIDHEFIPSAGQNESLRTDPSRNSAEKLGFDGGHFLDAEVKGPVPFWIPPGLAAVFVVPLDAKKAGYTESESVKARTLTLSATGSPRYYQ